MKIKIVIMFFLLLAFGTACLSGQPVSSPRTSGPATVVLQEVPLNIVIGKTTYQELASVLGPPSSVSGHETYQDAKWEGRRIYTVTLTAGNNPPTVTKYRTISVNFSNKDSTAIDFYGYN